MINTLLNWKESFQKKPILLIGARGVGKTYLAYDFAKAFYSELIYINFEREPYLFDLFDKNDSSAISDMLQESYHLSGTSNPILLILDEINACPNISKVIRLISEANTNYHIITISSISIEIKEIANMFIQMQLFPLDFEEFLIATGNEWYIEVIRSHYDTNKGIPDIVHQELLSLLDDYLYVGGMPSSVNEYINMETKYNVSEQHRILIDSYLSNVNQYNSEGESLKISQVLATMDKQLIKENRKFQYTLIRKGATQAVYADALNYIQNTFYGIRCYKIGDIPLASMCNCNPADTFVPLETEDLQLGFKLYFQDVGLLHSTIRTQYRILTDHMRKGIIENYVAQCLSSKGYSSYFWESSSQAKVDFIIMKDKHIIPIEVRTDDNTRSKNISVFKSKCNSITDSIKISTKNFDYSNNVKYVPTYAVFCI